ncbi:hypothetical protein L6R50_04115 [Myxococcota bacterium]|nr:hypothetical protein [Myxococcota bacterium]
MLRRVDQLRADARFDDALDVLERFLARHQGSYAGWRSRVLIRMEQDRRADAAREYARLAAALSRHAPEVLRDVVLGSGGQWLTSDYGALARCGPAGIADAAFFRDALTPKPIYPGSDVLVAVPGDRVAAAMRALPGRLGAESAEVIALGMDEPEALVRGEAARAALRLWRGGTRGDDVAELVRRGLGDGSPEARRALLRDLTAPGAGEAAAAFPPPLSDDDPGLAALLAAWRTARSAAGDAGALAEAARIAAVSGGLPRTITLAALARDGGGPPPPSPGIALDARATVVSTRAPGRPGPPASAATALEEQAAGAPGAERLAAAWALARAWPRTYPAELLAASWRAAAAEDRREAAAALSAYDPADGGILVTTVTADGDTLVRAALARGIRGWTAGAERGAALAALLRDASPAVRAAAAETAASLADPDLAPALGAAFDAADASTKVQVLAALAAAGTGPYAPLARGALADPDPAVREGAVDAVVASCDPAGLEALVAALGDPEPHVSVRAAAAVYLLVGGSGSPPVPPAAGGG